MLNLRDDIHMIENSYSDEILSLFHPGELGTFTCAGGYSHAKYQQYTPLSRHIYGQIFGILDNCGVEYFIFAGSMVGFIRNGRMPYWMDDIDIMIFPDQVQLFEDIALVCLERAGFNCFRPHSAEAGGFHILSMQQSNHREATVPLSDGKAISIPWAQVDVFYSIVDDDGFVRNKGGWGLYHEKNVPFEWVFPGRFVDVDGMALRTFTAIESDILREYGDVNNNIVVYSHSSEFLRLADVPWSTFDDQFKRVLEESSSSLPAGIDQFSFDNYDPRPHEHYFCTEGESFSSICLGIIDKNASAVHLADGEQIFWAMDLKRLFPAIAVHAVGHSVLHAQRAAHLRAFIDTAKFTYTDALVEYERCRAELYKVFGS